MLLARSGSCRGRRGVLVRLAVGCFASTLVLSIVAAAAAAATLDRIRETGVLRLGYITAARPFSYSDESGKPAGYAVELCERVAADLGKALSMPALRTEFVAIDARARFEAVAQGKIDLLCGGGTPTLSLREKVSFSIPIFPGGIGALVRADAPSRLRNTLAGVPERLSPRWRGSLGQVLHRRTFAVAANSRAADWLERRISELDVTAKIVQVESFDQGLDQVVTRRADVMFADREILLDAVRRSPAARELMVIERKFTQEPLSFALPRGDEDFRLAVDRALSRLYRTPDLVSLYTPVFGPPGDETLVFFYYVALPE